MKLEGLSSSTAEPLVLFTGGFCSSPEHRLSLIPPGLPSPRQTRVIAPLSCSFRRTQHSAAASDICGPVPHPGPCDLREHAQECSRTTADGCDEHRTTLNAGDLDGSLPVAMGHSSKHVPVLRRFLLRLRRSPVLRCIDSTFPEGCWRSSETLVLGRRPRSLANRIRPKPPRAAEGQSRCLRKTQFCRAGMTRQHGRAIGRGDNR